MDTVKVFWTGRSQAVKLPTDYRFESDEVRIRRRGSAIILEPIATNWSWLDALTGQVDADFITAAIESVSEQMENELPSSRKAKGKMAQHHDNFDGRLKLKANRS